MTVFDEQYARYYDLLYADKDYDAEASYVASLLRRHRLETKTILELGCGTGRHADLLANHGFRIHGVDRSEAMIQRATARAASRPGSLSFGLGDATSFRTTERFDAVISLFHVVSYQTTNEAVQDMFRTAATHLKDGGIFIFDVWYGPAVLTQRPDVRIKRLEDGEYSMTRIAEPSIDFSRDIVDVNYTILSRHKETGAATEIKETHRMRYLFQPEIQLLLHQEGLVLSNSEEWLTRRPASDLTWSVCFSAVKAKSS